VVIAKLLALTVDSRRADDVGLEHVAILVTSLKHDLVNVAVESRVREVGELVHASPVVVLLVGPLAESVVLAVFPCQDTSATGVQPVAGLLLGVAGANALSNGLSGTLVVRSIGRVCLQVSLCREIDGMVAINLRKTTSALAASSLMRSESSLPPSTIRMLG
jgi:hypothetical protein